MLSREKGDGNSNLTRGLYFIIIPVWSGVPHPKPVSHMNPARLIHEVFNFFLLILIVKKKISLVPFQLQMELIDLQGSEDLKFKVLAKFSILIKI